MLQNAKNCNAPPKTQIPEMGRKKRRVAGYARVSTDREEQLTSFEAQLEYYTNLINANPDWEFVGMYSDEGISGCSTKARKGFNQMIDDAVSGKIEIPTSYMIQNIPSKHCKYAKNRAFSA